jgi:hypothetical protein
MKTGIDWRVLKAMARDYVDEHLSGYAVEVALYNDKSDQAAGGVQIGVRVRPHVRMSMQVGVCEKDGPYQECWITGADTGSAYMTDFDEALRDITRVGEKLQGFAELARREYRERRTTHARNS